MDISLLVKRIPYIDLRFPEFMVLLVLRCHKCVDDAKLYSRFGSFVYAAPAETPYVVTVEKSRRLSPYGGTCVLCELRLAVTS